RSFEIAAAGGCMLAQDTDEHREIFGPEGEAVVYFRDAKEAAQHARALLCDLSERKRLVAGLHRRIVGGAPPHPPRLFKLPGLPERQVRARECQMNFAV